MLWRSWIIIRRQLPRKTPIQPSRPQATPTPPPPHQRTRPLSHLQLPLPTPTRRRQRRAPRSAHPRLHREPRPARTIPIHHQHKHEHNQPNNPRTTTPPRANGRVQRNRKGLSRPRRRTAGVHDLHGRVSGWAAVGEARVFV